MTSTILACFVPSQDDHVSNHSYTLVERNNNEGTMIVTTKESSSFHSMDECLDEKMMSEEKMSMIEEEENQDIEKSINPEVVVQNNNDNISLKEPSSMDHSDKQSISGLELVLYKHPSLTVKNSLDGTIDIDEETARSNQGLEEVPPSQSPSEKITITDMDTIEIARKPLYKLKHNVEHIGKHLKQSKTKVTWNFQHGDDQDAVGHLITLTWSKFSSKILIHMNDDEIYSMKATRSTDDNFFLHKWNSLDGLNIEILSSQKTSSGLTLWNHKLTINGELYSNFLP